MKRSGLGVDWTLPGKKRRFATTTKATSDLIVMLAEDGHTVGSARRVINFDDEAKAVLAVFEDHGFEDMPLRLLVK